MTLRSDTSMVPMPGFAAASAAWHAGKGTASPFTVRSTAGGNGGKTRGWSDQARYKAALAQGHRWHGKVPEDAAPQAEMRSGPAPGIAAQIADGLRSAGLGQMAQRYLAPPSPGDAALSIVPHVIGKAVESGVRAVTAPLRAWKGEIAPEAMIEEGRNVAGFAMTGGMAIPKPANSAGIFGGRLAKTADHAALAKAETMAAEGAPRETIWKETGWFQGADKKWRFEIDDSGARIAPWQWSRTQETAGVTVESSLGGGVDHSALWSAYPHLGDGDLRLMRTLDGGSGAWSRETRSAFVRGRSESEARSVALHEMQHGVQGEEGFASGGSPRQFSFSEINAERTRLMAGDSSAGDKWPSDIARGLYDRLAGEVEARAVQHRNFMSADQRRARPPWLDYDVAEGQQIVRFDSKVSEARPRALSPDEEAGLIAGKRSGTSNPELADIHGIDERTVQRILRRNGVEAGKPGRPRSYDASGLAKAHAQGISASALAVRYGVKLSTIERRLRAIATSQRAAAKQAAE